MSDSILKELPEALAKADNLPSLPTVAVEVLRLTQDENSSLDDMASVLSRDPALSAKLLKLSNSSLFNTGQAITTIQRATMVLGMKTVKLMSLSFSLVNSLPKSGGLGGFDFQQYWRRSITTAVSARSLARLIGSRDGDEAFLCGLLGHLGKLVLCQCMEEEYGELVAEAPDGWPSLELEESRLGFHGADVGAALMKEWKLPERVCLSVGFMYRPDQLAEDLDVQSRDLVELLHAAAQVEAVLCSQDPGPAMKTLHEACKRYYDLGSQEVDAFLVGLESGIRETAEMLNLSLSGDLTHEELVARARQQMMAVSIGAIGDMQQEKRVLQSEKEELAARAHTDKLTGLPNRAAFDDFLERHVHSRLRGEASRSLGLVLLDVDHFKKFNDTYGHQVGDDVLRLMGAVMRRLTRKGDLAARYGGEEFALVAPHTTSVGIKAASERLRKAIEAASIEVDGERVSVTASFGAVCIARVEEAEDGERLVKLADECLYRAKGAGRNRTECLSRVRIQDGPQAA